MTKLDIEKYQEDHYDEEKINFIARIMAGISLSMEKYMMN